jgi:phosphatidylserine/phosphatidylglycerophosphate/cardiolipin synthase-like enzyme
MKTSQNSYSRIIRFLLILALGLSACDAMHLPPPSQVTQTPGTDSFSSWLGIYFTDPSDVRAADYEGGPDESLAAAIDRSRLSVDMAAYSLNLWSIRDALIHAHQRGVNVRLVMESDNMDNREVQQLKEAAIPVIGDRHEGLMHNKFIVIDRSEVWTGSMNFTAGGTYKDNNNMIRIRSAQAAEDYTTVFDEMFVTDLFGTDSRPPNLYTNLTINGTPVEIYFSPEDGVAAKIHSLIQAATSSIYFMAYSFTSNDLGDALLKKAADGLVVAGVLDDGQVNSDQGAEFDRFVQSGLDVRRDGNAGLMHHKVIIIDSSIVVTGSYNFSASAEQANDENVVVIHNADVAARFMHEFQRIFDQAQP